MIDRLREVTKQTLDDLAKDAKIKKVYDSFTAFKAKHDSWAGVSEGVYQSQIRG